MGDDQELRAAAEKHLRALAGENARLREDQWTAIRALVAEKPRAAFRQRARGGRGGDNFRPAYRRIRTLLETLPAGIPVLATTATANARVTTDVAEQLEAGVPDDSGGVVVLRGALG